MRVICLVPSITETLIECGIKVVGRTRFCIHPATIVQDVPRVGGTKGVDWQRCRDLLPDMVIFDREENLKEMADECPFPWIATHINSIESAAIEFAKLGDVLNSPQLLQHATDWTAIAAQPNNQDVDWQQVPGQLQQLMRVKTTSENSTQQSFSRIEYIIWRAPWMAVGTDTFIRSMLTKLGFADYLPNHSSSYPTLTDAEMTRSDTFYLFSSEPYRFLRYQEQLEDAGYVGAIVDGELYSWFGIRSLRGLQSILR